MRVWRIVRREHAADAFSGAGGLKYAARWNRRGTRIVYTADSLALAALEFFVNLEFEDFPLVAIAADLPEAITILALGIEDLPPDWRAYPAPASTQQIGTRWATERRSAVLSVPSALVPAERNYLLNPTHPEFRKITIGRPQPFSFTHRMWKRRR